MAGINKLMQIGRAVQAVRGTDETLNFSWPIRSSVAHPHKCLHEFSPGWTGCVVSHIGTSTPYGVFMAYAVI